MSHSLIVLSGLPEPSVLPSGLYATDRTRSVCPRRVACSLGSCADKGDIARSPRQATPHHRPPPSHHIWLHRSAHWFIYDSWSASAAPATCPLVAPGTAGP